ncbi:MAG: phospholipase D-like domain-containing protein [Chromatiales bacterium]|jgi:phosphatidylserine/phosphatidylglycerophosphate/cardiolipin synthase-like enzyme
MNVTQQTRYRFPSRAGNRIRMLVDGDVFFPTMLSAIASAGREILLEMYLVEDGTIATRFSSALAAAARRGVGVYALLDDLGARGLGSAHRRELSKAGVAVAYYNPVSTRRVRRSLHRDHRKLLLIDGGLAYVGGAGLVDSFSSETAGAHHWHDLMLELQGPCAADWRMLFDEAWSRSSRTELPATPLRPGASPDGVRGRVSVGMGPGRQEITRSLLQRIRKSRQRIWLATAYFAPTRRLRKQLKRAARRGIDVRLLLPGARSDHPLVWYAGRRYYGRLLRQGVRIFEYQPRFTHTKLYLCDDWTSLGSANLDHWTSHWNLEANQEIEDERFAARVVALFDQDFGQSHEITWADWRSRGLVRRVLERVIGWLHAWIVRTSYREAMRADIGSDTPESDGDSGRSRT